MTAIITKPLKYSSKIVTGEVLLNDPEHITLIIIDKTGSKRIKRYRKNDWIIRIF